MSYNRYSLIFSSLYSIMSGRRLWVEGGSASYHFFFFQSSYGICVIISQARDKVHNVYGRKRLWRIIMTTLTWSCLEIFVNISIMLLVFIFLFFWLNDLILLYGNYTWFIRVFIYGVIYWTVRESLSKNWVGFEVWHFIYFILYHYLGNSCVFFY